MLSLILAAFLSNPPARSFPQSFEVSSPLPPASIEGLFASEPAANDTTALWQQANAAFNRGDFAEARRILSQAVRVNPNDAALWFHLGVSCSQVGDAGAAISAFEHARLLAPRRSETYFDLGLLYWKTEDLGKAKQAYKAGLALNPKEPSALQNYALLLMKTGDYKTAIVPLTRLKSDPALALSARVSLIECYLKTQQPNEADSEAEEVMHSNATPADQTKVAAILMDNNAPQTAEKVLLHSLALNPDQDAANEALGLVYLREKRFADASPLLERATQLNPDSADYAMAFAQVLLLWNHSAGLLAILKSVEPKFANLPEFQYALGLAYYGTSHYGDAVSTLQGLLDKNPRRQDQIYYWLGNCYLELGKLDQSEQAYRKSIEMNPKDPAHYEGFAILMRQEGADKLGDAITQLKRVHQLNPGDPGISLQLALCYESEGQLQDAATLLEEAVQRDPELRPAHVALSRIYFRLGRKADANREKQTVSELERKQQQSTQSTASRQKSLMDDPVH